MRIWFLFTFHVADTWGKFSNSAAKVIMLWESCESRFLCENESYHI